MKACGDAGGGALQGALGALGGVLLPARTPGGNSWGRKGEGAGVGDSVSDAASVASSRLERADETGLSAWHVSVLSPRSAPHEQTPPHSPISSAPRSPPAVAQGGGGGGGGKGKGSITRIFGDDDATVPPILVTRNADGSTPRGSALLEPQPPPGSILGGGGRKQLVSTWQFESPRHAAHGGSGGGAGGGVGQGGFSGAGERRLAKALPSPRTPEEAVAMRDAQLAAEAQSRGLVKSLALLRTSRFDMESPRGPRASPSGDSAS